MSSSRAVSEAGMPMADRQRYLEEGDREITLDNVLPLRDVTECGVNNGHKGWLWFAVPSDFGKGSHEAGATPEGFLTRKDGFKYSTDTPMSSGCLNTPIVSNSSNCC